MEKISESAAELAKVLMDPVTIATLYVAAKTMRDSTVTPMLNKGVKDPEERKKYKLLYSGLDKFVNAYEAYAKPKRGSR